MASAKQFVNFSTVSFTHSWDSVPYTFEPGKVYMLEDWKADHFAKHLVDRELMRMGKQVNDTSRQDLLAMALPAESPKMEAEDGSSLESKLLNETVKPKVGRKKKNDEEDFAGL
jgi:hypothetical protein